MDGEKVTRVPDARVRPWRRAQWSFADWFGGDLTGQTYEGDLDCRNVGLTSLEGAPAKVEGDFDCSNNFLDSLAGAPEEVSGAFRCSNNRLGSPEGAPACGELGFGEQRPKPARRAAGRRPWRRRP